MRTVVVTGAASGVGRAIALRLASDGTRLVLLDIAAEDLAVVAQESAPLSGAAVLSLVTDVSDPDAVREAFATVVAQFGVLDAVACAAGVLRPGSLAEVTPQDWHLHFAVNTTGVLNVLQAAGPALRDNGAVVVVSSNAGRVPRTGMLAYAASKAATSALVRCIGLELAPRGIRCNTVEPGSTRTPMQSALWPDGSGAALAVAGDPASFRLGIPLGRVAEPEDIASVARFLLSDEARHITLQQIYVDGGASL